MSGSWRFRRCFFSNSRLWRGREREPALLFQLLHPQGSELFGQGAVLTRAIFLRHPGILKTLFRFGGDGLLIFTPQGLASGGHVKAHLTLFESWGLISGSLGSRQEENKGLRGRERASWGLS